jgi:hypothetical protein
MLKAGDLIGVKGVVAYNYAARTQQDMKQELDGDWE